MVQLRDYQVEALALNDQYYQLGHQVTALVLCTGAGKCHGVNTPILMYDGSVKPVQDVIPGDVLMGPDSTPRNVLSIARGREELFNVTPTKGESHVVNRSHILSLKDTRSGYVKNICVDDYLSKGKRFKHNHKLWRTGVEFDNPEIEDKYLPPYMLGVWLGDGTSLTASITTMDREVVWEITKYAVNTNQKIRLEDQPNNKSKIYHVTCGGRRSNSMKSSLNKNNLIGDKHIPHDYKTAPREQRLELLAGIIDTGGHLSHNGIDLVFKQKKLADDVVFVARSLGLAAYVKECTKSIKSLGFTGVYHRISISGDLSVVPCRVQRRKAQPRKQKKSVLRTGFTLESKGEGDYYGFEIDGDHLYLLGDFTVTHNTICKAAKAFEYYQQGKQVVLFAHRDVLISQISDALCMYGVYHQFVAAAKTVRDITNANLKKHGNGYHDHNSRVYVLSTTTMVARLNSKDEYRAQMYRDMLAKTDLWLMDECHHLIKDSGAGKIVEAMPNARGIGVTATLIRGDNKGLGSDSDGYFSAFSQTVSMIDLIRRGNLTPYKIFSPDVKFSMKGVKVTSGGDYNEKETAQRVDKREITGDAVDHYLRHLNGKRVITFGVNISHCDHIAQQFNEAGIPSKSVSAKTPLAERNQALDDLKSGVLLNLVNCNLFGEGFDAPAVEGVIMLRPTQSYSLYKQQFGRMLRKSDGKLFGVLLDHVGNTFYMMKRFGLYEPHDDPEWTLERGTRRAKSSDSEVLEETVRCLECNYGPARVDAFVNGCPHCGYVETEEDREQKQREIQQVSGELVELSVDAMAEILIEREKVDTPMDVFANRCRNMPGVARNGALSNHAKRFHQQTILRDRIQRWCAWYHRENPAFSMETVQREFARSFGENIFKAQTLSAKEAELLTSKIPHKD